MAGLYIHIPFCRQKCHYCNFFSLATTKYRNEILDALLSELKLQKKYPGGEKLETIYFGGGTPSLYNPVLLEEIIQKAAKIFTLDDDAEITLEANPDDISLEWLQNLKETSVNRLSIGIQSFFDEDLKYLNRVHTAEEAGKTVEMVRDFGFENLSIDFIYGIPTLSNNRWLENLKIAADLKIPHISAYALTVEPGTALDLFIRKGKYENVDDAKAEAQFNIMMNFLGENGYEHYEISNFALPGEYARHNTSYWSGKKYLGIGPSAHSFDGDSRQWNIANMGKYLEGISSGMPDFEKEVLTRNQKINEYIMTSLRTMWGMDMMKIEKDFGAEVLSLIKNSIQQYKIKNHLYTENGIVKLTREGKLFADRIASDLFIGD